MRPSLHHPACTCLMEVRGSDYDSVGMEQLGEGSCRRATVAGVSAASLAANMQGMCQCAQVQPCSTAPAAVAFLFSFFFQAKSPPVNPSALKQDKPTAPQFFCHTWLQTVGASCYSGGALVHMWPCGRLLKRPQCCLSLSQSPSLPSCCPPDLLRPSAWWGKKANNNSRTTHSCNEFYGTDPLTCELRHTCGHVTREWVRATVAECEETRCVCQY